MALTPNFSVGGLMTSSDCGGDDDDDGDDVIAFIGDDVMSSVAAVVKFALGGCGVPPPTDPGVAVVHLAAHGCSQSGDGVDGA